MVKEGTREKCRVWLWGMPNSFTVTLIAYERGCAVTLLTLPKSF